MTKLIDVFHNFANAPISAIIPLWNINRFVFLKTVSVKSEVKNYQVFVWYIKVSCCGTFTEFSFLA